MADLNPKNKKRSIPYVQGKSKEVKALPNYEGLIDSPTAKAFFELVKDKKYKLGAKGTGNWTSANGGSSTSDDEIDCSGAICTVRNSQGGSLELNNTNAASFKGRAKHRNIDVKNSVDGDIILIKSKGGGIDHIGFVVVDSDGRRYIAESSSSYNGTTITPYQERMSAMKDSLPNLSYEIISDQDKRPTPKKYNTNYEHVGQAENIVRPPLKLLNPNAEKSKSGITPFGFVYDPFNIVEANEAMGGSKNPDANTFLVESNSPALNPSQQQKNNTMADTKKQNNKPITINSLYKKSKSKDNLLSEKEIKFLERQKSLNKEDSNNYKLSNALINKNKIKKVFENYKTSKTRLDELKKADVYNMSDEEFNQYKAEKNNLDVFINQTENVLSGITKIKQEKMGGLPDITTLGKKLYNYFQVLDEKIGNEYKPDEAFYEIPEENQETKININEIAEKLTPLYKNIKPFDSTPTETIEDDTTEIIPTTTTPTTATDKIEEEVNVNDLPKTDEEVNVDDLPKTDEEILVQKQKELEAIQSAESFVPEEYDDTYLPDQQDDRDLLGTALDVGQGIAGAIAVSEELPEYSMSPEQRLAIDEATARRNMGLSPDELGFIERGQEEAYGYDIKNIEKASGSSAGIFLGNIGRAQSQLYAQKARTAALEQSMRRQNLANFQNMAGRSENINRQIFLDNLRQAEKTKMAGAQTLADSISSIKEREQLEKAYGKGSQFYALQKATTLNMKHRDVDARNAARLNLFNQEQDLVNKKNELTSSIEELQRKTEKNLNPSNNKSIESTLLNYNQATKKQIDTRSLNSINIDSKIKSLTTQMKNTDDVDKAMEIDSEINKLKDQRRKGKGIGTNTRKSLFANK